MGLFSEKKSKTVKVCPKCGSMDVSSDLSVQSYAQGGFFNNMVCNNCGYSGQLFPEVNADEVDKK